MAIILNPTVSEAPVTAYSLIRRAYKILGDVSESDALTAAQETNGLEALNAMLDSFSIERLFIYHLAQTELTWPANTVSRTIGSGGNFDIRRPDRVEDGTYFKDSNNISYDVDVVRNREVYDGVYEKTITSSYPEMLFYEPSYPLGALYVYPIPNQSLTFYLNQWSLLQVFETITEVLSLPPGHKRMIAYNLAVELEAETGLPCPDSAKKIAAASKRIVKRQNNLPLYSSTDVFYVTNGRGKTDIVAGR